MNTADIEKINVLLTQINDTRERIKLLSIKQNDCKSDSVWWGIQKEMDDQNENIIKCEDKLLSLIKSLCLYQFDIDIEEANKIRDRANQAILDLKKYKPANYKRFIPIIAEVADINSDIPF